MSTLAHFVGRRELLSELGVSKTTILRWTDTRGFPRPLPGSGQIPIYDRAAINEWLNGRLGGRQNG
jgi:predicted DNA-binding transcriptional regulator AlpA